MTFRKLTHNLSSCNFKLYAKQKNKFGDFKAVFINKTEIFPRFVYMNTENNEVLSFDQSSSTELALDYIAQYFR